MSNGVIFTNFHYAGHRDWNNDRPRLLTEGHELVLTTDGLRTAKDFNHKSGMNVLRGDCSVRWRDDTDQLYNRLPRDDSEPPSPDYPSIWEVVATNH